MQLTDEDVRLYKDTIGANDEYLDVDETQNPGLKKLKGKSYYTKQERDRQLAVAGSTIADDGDYRGTFEKKKGAVTASDRDIARAAIESLLTEKGEMRLKDIIEATGLTAKSVHDVVYKDPGRITKTGWGVYGLTGVSSQTASSA